MLPDGDVQDEVLVGFLTSGRRGMPIPTFDNLDHEAEVWASWAPLAERRAYHRAIWRRMTAAQRDRFIAWASERRASA